MPHLAGTLDPRVPGVLAIVSGRMPTYEYRCKKGHNFDVMQRMSDDPVTTCEVCGAPVARVFHPIAVHFKGSGFYNTDYGTRQRSREMKEAKEGSKSESSNSNSSSGDSKSGSNSDSGSHSDSGSKSDSGSSTSSDSGAKKSEAKTSSKAD